MDFCQKKAYNIHMYKYAPKEVMPVINGKTVGAIIVGGGSSARMGFDKLLHPINGVCVLQLATLKMDQHPAIDSLVLVAGQNINTVRDIFKKNPTKKPLAIVPGGSFRAASVQAGLLAGQKTDLIAIHDAARPFVSAQLISRTVEAAEKTGAAAPATFVKDTIKQLQKTGDLVQKTLPRPLLRAVQTPQVFCRTAYEKALSSLTRHQLKSVTDDCMVMELAKKEVMLVEGEEENRKITTPQDLPEKAQNLAPIMRIGHGYDVHRLVPERPLILGGVTVPNSLGLLGHSDADVLLHAVCDAILGAAGLGDIGRHFPDSDQSYKNANSMVLFAHVAGLIKANGWCLCNLDANILCQRPKLAPHIPAMQANIAKVLCCHKNAVSVKATTEEGLGFTGQEKGIAAHCVVLLQKRAEELY